MSSDTTPTTTTTTTATSPSSAVVTHGAVMPTNFVAVKGVGFSETQNARYRRTMEDAHVVIDKFGGRDTDAFFAIYDGHGGSEAAKIVADLLHVHFEDELKDKDVEEAFMNAYTRTDDKLHEMEMMYMGTTSVTCYLHVNEDGDKFLYTANAGDARAVLGRDGKAERLSYDHKASDQAEITRVRENDGFVGNGRVNGFLSVSRALGDHSMKKWVISEPYIWTAKIEPHQKTVLIVACDGLWDVMTDDEAVAFIKDVEDPQVASKMLMDRALEQGSMDNISILVVHF